jgi:hypothetical protein
MELNDFKKAWQDASSDKVHGKELDVAKINEMLIHRGSGILSRLDRSVKIVIWFLIFFFILTLADQLLPADRIFPDNMKSPMIVPMWIGILEWIVNIALILTILFFIVKYRRLQVHTLVNQDLKGALEKVLQLLDTFKKGFYLTVVIFVSSIGLGFLSGVHQGFETLQIFKSPSTQAIVFVVCSMFILFGLLVGSIFYIFHKGFNLLFGKYRDQLIQSLNELQEIGE